MALSWFCTNGGIGRALTGAVFGMATSRRYLPQVAAPRNGASARRAGAGRSQTNTPLPAAAVESPLDEALERVQALVCLLDDDPLRGGTQFNGHTVGVWFDGVAETVQALSASVPVDVADREELQLTRGLVPLRAAALVPDLDEVGVQAAMMLHLTSELGRKLRRQQLQDPVAARDMLLADLGSLPDEDLARILGVTRQTLALWRGGQVPTRNGARITNLAIVVSALLGSYTPAGVKLWLEAPRPELDGHATLEGLVRDPQATWERLAPTLRNLRG